MKKDFVWFLMGVIFFFVTVFVGTRLVHRTTPKTAIHAETLALPTCNMIYIGGCQYVCCLEFCRGGIDRVDPTCKPTDANVSTGLKN